MFQNFNPVFDKVFADDKGHVRGFKYFNQFKNFGEVSDIITGKIAGRENDNERILSYNVGIGIHYAYFAYQILKNDISRSNH